MGQIVPTRGYVICSEHRSGSTFLCQLLKSTGKLGNPREFFSDHELCKQVEANPRLLARMIEEASSANGIYGLKIFTQQFDVTAGSRWPELLPNLSFIHLERRDLLGQAISLAKALQTEQYEADQSPRVEPSYDRRTIGRHLGRIAEGQERWRRYFARNGIQPLWLVYEEVVSDPEGAVAAVAAHLALDGDVAIKPELVTATVQRDASSEQWRSRYVAESANLGYLDHPLGRSRVWLRRRARDAWYFVQRLRRR
jgi:LPS sulfotransferase NodH